MQFTPLYAALLRARLVHPGYAMPVTHYAPGVAIRASMPFGAYIAAARTAR